MKTTFRSPATVILVCLLTVSGLLPVAAKGQGEPAATASGLTPITFTMFLGEPGPNADGFQSPVAKEIQRQTGVTLEIEYVVTGDETEKLSLMAASGDYPDLIYPKTSTYIVKNAGGIIKLDELIDKYGPDIKKFYGDQIKRLRFSNEDRGIYFVGGFAFGEENLRPDENFQLQHIAVKEAGFPRVRTLQDFENVIKSYYAKHPTYNGQPTIPFMLLTDGWRFGITINNAAVFATGGPDDGEWYVDQKTFKVVRHVMRPEEREYFRWLNHMNASGLLDPESFVQKYDQYKSKIASGRVIALTDSRWEINEPLKALKQAGLEDRMYGFYPVTLNESIKSHSAMSYGYLVGGGVCISTKCKDPIRAIQFLNWMCTEKSQVLTHWGIEGEHYTIVDGKRVMKPEIVQMQATDPAFGRKTGIGLYTYPFPYYGNVVKDSTGQYYEAFETLEKIIAGQSPIENEIMKAYGVRTWKDLTPASSEFPVKPYGAAWLMNTDDPDYNAIENQVTDIGYKMIPAAILADPSKFDAAFDAYIQAIQDAGVEKLAAVMEQKIKERVEMWK